MISVLQTPLITFTETDAQNGGRFVEIIGTPNVVITERTTYPFTIRTTGSVCDPDEAVGSITVSPLIYHNHSSRNG